MIRGAAGFGGTSCVLAVPGGIVHHLLDWKEALCSLGFSLHNGIVSLFFFLFQSSRKGGVDSNARNGFDSSLGGLDCSCKCLSRQNPNTVQCKFVLGYGCSSTINILPVLLFPVLVRQCYSAAWEKQVCRRYNLPTEQSMTKDLCPKRIG